MVSLALAAAALAWRLYPRGAPPPLDCAPEQVRVVEGVARCASADGAGDPLPAAAIGALGGRFDLNQVSEAELAAIPGIGRSVAEALVRARTDRGGRFESWSEVDEVPGVGPARLERLREVADLRHP